MNVERLAGGACGRPFPVYEDLVGNLLAAHGSADAGRDAVVAHVLGTCAGYAYADIETVAMIMSRLGLEGSACVRIAQIVDAMHIFSTAYLVQSRCGRVVILCYRGTEPANLGNWLTDADVGSASLTLGGDALVVHAGILSQRSVHAPGRPRRVESRPAGEIAARIPGRASSIRWRRCT